MACPNHGRPHPRKLSCECSQANKLPWIRFLAHPGLDFLHEILYRGEGGRPSYNLQQLFGASGPDSGPYEKPLDSKYKVILGVFGTVTSAVLGAGAGGALREDATIGIVWLINCVITRIRIGRSQCAGLQGRGSTSCRSSRRRETRVGWGSTISNRLSTIAWQEFQFGNEKKWTRMGSTPVA